MLCRLVGDSTMSNTSTVLSERVTCSLPVLGAGMTSRGVTSMTSSVPSVGDSASGVPEGKLMATVELPGTWVSTNSEGKSPGLNMSKVTVPASGCAVVTMVMFCKLPQRTALAISLEANGSELQTISPPPVVIDQPVLENCSPECHSGALWVLEFSGLPSLQGTRMAPIERSTFKLKMAYS